MPARSPVVQAIAPNYRAIAAQQAAKYGLPPGVFARQIQQESRFNPNARSPAGAIGIAQIVPRYHPGVDPTNPVEALAWSAKYMAGLVHKYGNIQQALSVYNSGRPDAYKDPGFAGGQTYNYVRKILGGGGAVAPTVGVAPAAATPSTPPVAQGGVDPRLLQAILSTRSAVGLDAPSSGMLEALQTRVPQPQPQPQGQGRVSPVQNTLAGSSPRGLALAKTAKTQLGIPYKWGGQAKLGQSTDCSGLLQAAAAQNGIQIPRVTYDQWKVGKPVAAGNLKPGDAMFFNMGARGPEHVGIYLGNGRMVEDPHTGAAVRISDVAKRNDFVGARRYT